MAQFSRRPVLLALSPALAERTVEIGAFLERFGLEVDTAASDTEVLAACGRAQQDAVVFDLPLVAGLGATTWLEKLKLISPGTAPVAIGAIEELETLRRVAQQGDGEYVLLPLHLAELKNRVRRLIEARGQRAPELDDTGGDDRSLRDLVGRSACMEAIRDRIRKVASLTSTVLITGESGVGKELIARGIHKASPRRGRAFIALNCSALPEALLESELFGHEKGAFTGAVGLSKGKFELAHNGTLFLDEIGDMNPYTQAKILRVLEEKEFMRVGGSRNLKVDVRLVAATNADLKQRMADGRFREDLYYRLKVFAIEVPPLRDRREDIPELARAFIDRFARANSLSPKRITDDALRALAAHSWPGNIRELRNALENMIVMAPGDVVDVDDMPGELLVRAAPAADPKAAADAAPGGRVGPGAAPVGSDGEGRGSSIEDMERSLIEDTLRQCGGNRTRAAQMLKIGVRTLQRKLKRYELETRS